MPTTRRSTTIAAPVEDIWTVASDPHHLPRWWPRVARVEAADERGFTQVLSTDKGRDVRADFRIVETVPSHLRRWEQVVEGTPFAGILRTSETTLTLDPEGDATRVTITLRQRLRGMARLGGWLVRRAARGQLDEALAGLERVCVD